MDGLLGQYAKDYSHVFTVTLVNLLDLKRIWCTLRLIQHTDPKHEFP